MSDEPTDPCPKGGNHDWQPSDYVTQGGTVRAYACPKCNQEKDGPV